ncbi:MAG: iron-siderophore ABC transporter substrate-binding protein [Micrococcaceae bacterium]
MAHSISRRKLITTFGLGGTATLVLSACGSNDSSSSGSSSSDFPVTIKHAFGQTEIKKKPTRVATVGWINQDILLSLGIKPVAMPKNTYGGDAQGYLPWTKEASDKISGDAPVLYSDTDGADFNAIAGAKPDVIIGAYSGISQDDYNKLSQIAPTVAYPSEPFATPLEQTISMIGQAVGQKSKAEQLYTDYQSKVKAEGQKYSAIQGKTFAYTNFTSDLSKFNLYAPDDARVELLNGLGMSTDDSVKELTKDSKAFYVELSAEKAEEVDPQVLVASAPDQDTMTKVVSSSLLGKIPALQKGTVASFFDPAMLMATSAVTPLSTDWAFQKGYVDTLNQAAQKVTN